MTAFLHYFFLATFTWTLCEAVLIYILLVKVFGANDKKWIYLYLALGWGKPLPTALTSLASWTGNCRPHLYLLRPHSSTLQCMLCEVQMVYTFIIIIYDIIIYYTTVYDLWGTNGVHIHTLKMQWHPFPLILLVLPIPIVVISGGVRNKDYLIRYSFNESHPNYDKFKAWVLIDSSCCMHFSVH